MTVVKQKIKKFIKYLQAAGATFRRRQSIVTGIKQSPSTIVPLQTALPAFQLKRHSGLTARISRNSKIVIASTSVGVNSDGPEFIDGAVIPLLFQPFSLYSR
jgi:hypothetical protein